MNDVLGSEQQYYLDLAYQLLPIIHEGWNEVVLEADFVSDGSKRLQVLRDQTVVSVSQDITEQIFDTLTQLREAVKKDENNKFSYCKLTVTSSGSFSVNFDYENNHLSE